MITITKTIRRIVSQWDYSFHLKAVLPLAKGVQQNRDAVTVAMCSGVQQQRLDESATSLKSDQNTISKERPCWPCQKLWPQIYHDHILTQDVTFFRKLWVLMPNGPIDVLAPAKSRHAIWLVFIGLVCGHLAIWNVEIYNTIIRVLNPVSHTQWNECNIITTVHVSTRATATLNANIPAAP